MTDHRQQHHAQLNNLIDQMTHDFKQFLSDVYDNDDSPPAQVFLHIIDIVHKMCQLKKEKILYSAIANKIANTVVILKSDDDACKQIMAKTKTIVRVVHRLYKQWLPENAGNKINVCCKVYPKKEYVIDIVPIESLPEILWELFH